MTEGKNTLDKIDKISQNDNFTILITRLSIINYYVKCTLYSNVHKEVELLIIKNTGNCPIGGFVELYYIAEIVCIAQIAAQVLTRNAHTHTIGIPKYAKGTII